MGSKAEATERFRANKDNIISRLIDGGETANKIRTEYGINGGWFSELLKQEGLAYDWECARWHRTTGTATADQIVATDPDLDDDEQSEIAELLNQQSKMIEKLTASVKTYQSRETAYVQEVETLKQKLTETQALIKELEGDAQRWREERHRRKLEQIHLSKQFAQEKIDEAHRVLA